jgi:glycosyltransferase involved in cell wall biosynthesis
MMKTDTIQRPVLSIVIPCYNEEQAISQTLEGLLALYEGFAEIIVVNDGSSDSSAEKVRAFPKVKLVEHKRNFGYGAALISGITEATTDLVCFYDSDGQHDPKDVARLYEQMDSADMVVGSRGTGAFKHLKRAPGKLILHALANLLSGRRIPDLNSGLRIVRRPILMQYLHLLPNGFSASTTTTMVFIMRNYVVTYVDIKVNARIGNVSQVKMLRDGIKTCLLILNMLVLFNPQKFFLMVSALFLGVGTVYGLYKICVNEFGLSVGSMLFFYVGFSSFFFGLICEQISRMRLERMESMAYRTHFKKKT